MEDRQDIIARHLASYRVDHDHREIEKTFQDILDAGTFLGEECRFLYWCCHEFGMQIPFPLPCVAELPVRHMPITTFQTNFVRSESRLKLFQNLIEYLNLLKISMELEYIYVVVGGSFVNPEKENPDDIDVIITIPADHYQKFEDNERAIKKSVRIPLGIDVVFLPSDFTLSSFRAFSRIMCLCNDLDVQPDDWQPFPIETITFSPRVLHSFSA